MPKEQVRDQDGLTLTDVLGYVPGVTVFAPSVGRVSDNISLRGFDASGSNGTFLRDGLKLNAGVYDSTTEPYGLERLDVIKGASSILYGQLGPGGLVNAVSKRPTSVAFGEVNTSFGSYGRKELSGDVGGPITPDGIWSYRVTGLVRDSDTFTRFIPDNRGYIAPALTYAPDQDTKLTVLGYYQQVDTRFPTPLPAIGTVRPLANGLRIPRETFLGEPSFDKFNARSGTIGYLFEHRFSDNFTLRQGLRYYQADTRWDYLIFGAVAANQQTISRNVSSRNENARGFTVDTSGELKVNTGALSHTFVAGVDYYRRVLDSDRFAGTTPATFNVFAPTYGRLIVPNFAVNNGSVATNDQTGLYLQDQVKLGERLVLLVGGRADFSDTTTRIFRTNLSTSQSDQATTGRVGLVYLSEVGLAPYMSYSTSFSPTIGTDRLSNPFVPTTGQQIEAGLRYQPPGTNILLSGAFFNLKQQNALTADPVNTTFSVQTGEVRSQGAEFEARTEFGPLSLIASYTYNDVRTTKSNTPTLIGERQPFVPLNAATLWGIYDFTSVGLPGFRAGGGLRYVGSTNLTGLTFDTQDYVTADLVASQDLGRLSPSLSGFEARLNVKNVLDKGYVVCTAATGCRYGDPRTIVGTLSYRW